MLIRPEIAADREQITELIRLAFAGDAEVRLVDALRREPDFLPGLSLVAVVDGREPLSNDPAGLPDAASLIVGHIFFSPITIGITPALALAPLAVRPEYQRRGIGSMLVRAGHAEAARMGHKIVVVVGHPRYYPRFGYRPARALGLEAPFPVSDEAFMVAELQPGALLEISGMVRYAAPFDACT